MLLSELMPTKWASYKVREKKNFHHKTIEPLKIVEIRRMNFTHIRGGKYCRTLMQTEPTVKLTSASGGNFLHRAKKQKEKMHEKQTGTVEHGD
jgi:hypothetical protein